MFSFKNKDIEPIMTDMNLYDVEQEYKDKYIVVNNTSNKDGYLHGDILAFLSHEEYSKLTDKEEIPKGYYIAVGSYMKAEY